LAAAAASERCLILRRPPSHQRLVSRAVTEVPAALRAFVEKIIRSPGHKLMPKAARGAGALQPWTRTLLTEIDIDNSDGVLTAGLYGIVRLSAARPQPTIVLSSDAVVFDKSGLFAAVYDNGVIHLRHLDLAADDGAQVEVRSGLKPGDRVVLNPPAELSDGMRVAAVDTARPITASADPMQRISASGEK